MSSAQQVRGGATIDAPPVRVLQHFEREKLGSVLMELIAEDHPVVPEPDWNDTRFKVGIRAGALGVKSWRAFVKDARCFHLRRAETGGLILEEWPKEGGSFSAKPAWRREFSAEAFGDVVDHLIKVTDSTERPEIGKRRPRKRAVAPSRVRT